MKNLNIFKIFIKRFSFLVVFSWIILTLIICLITLSIFKLHSQKEGLIFVSNITKKQINITNPYSPSSALIIAIHNLILYFLIHPLSWLMNQIINIIIFLGSGNLLNDLMFHNVSKYHLPKTFWITLIISISLSFVFIIYKLIFIMIARQEKQIYILNETSKNIIILFIFVPLVPIIFYLLNQILIIIIYFLISKNNFINLPVLIFNSSFLDYVHNIKNIPISTDDPCFLDQNNFSYTLCTIMYISIVYIMINVSKTLLISLIELFWLFIITTAVLFSIIIKIDNSYEILKQHNSMVIQHLLIFSSIFLAFNIFLNSISIIINSIEDSELKINFSKTILISLTIFVYSFFILEIPLLIYNLIGYKNRINPFSHAKSIFVFVKGNGRRVTKNFSKTKRLTSNNLENFKPREDNRISYEEKINNNINLKNNNKK